jgi:VPS28 protein
MKYVIRWYVDANVIQEVKLHNGTPSEKRIWDDLATIYSIIVSLEFVEKAYVRDTITQAQYFSLLSVVQNKN